MRLRPVDPSRDFDAVLGVLQACDRAVYGGTDWTEDELREQWGEIDLTTDSWVAEDAGSVVGVMHLCERRDDTFIGDGYVAPAARGRGVGSALVKALEARVIELLAVAPASSGRATVHLAHLVGDETAPELLALHGYARVRSFFRMVIALDGPPEPPTWPRDVDVRTIDPERDGPAVHETDVRAFSGQWGYRAEPYPEWHERLFVTPRLDPSLSVAAWSGDRVAGFALNYPKRMGDWGWVSVLGVDPDWRRQGLGLALLRESFARFHAAGETTVALGVDSENPTGATRLYERAGMRRLWQADVWEKELARSPGTTAATEIRAPVVSDAPRLAALLNAHAVAVDGEESTTEDEVRSWFSLPGLQPEHDMRVAVGSDGALFGYADIAGQETGPLHVDLRVPPGHAWAMPLLLDSMETRAGARGAPPRALRVPGSSADAAIGALLGARGYSVIRSSFRMETTVVDEPPLPTWPAGITVRPSRGPDDLPGIYAAAEEAFADHWGYQPLTFEEWCAWNVRETLDPSVWFLAEDGAETAGVSLCRLDETPDRTLGWVSILGVRRAWRGRGIARALLLHSFHALRARGCTRVGLGVDAENTTGAVRLYESVGMRVVRRGDTWERGAG